MQVKVKYINTQEVICNINYDQWPESPRDWDNLGKMVLSHRDYNFPNDAGIDFEDFESWQEVEKHLIKEEGAYIILPVQMYDHSGIRIYVGDTHDRWDGGQLGYIFVTRDDVLKNFNVKRITKELKEKVTEILKSEVNTYSKYVNGEVYYYTLEDSVRGVEIDSCSGYYSIDDIKKELSEYENITYRLEGAELNY